MFWWQEKGKLEVFIKSNRYLVTTEDFIKHLEKETAKCHINEEFYTTLDCVEETGPVICVVDRKGNYSLRNRTIYQKQKARYDNVLHFILCNMEYTVKVQIYDDGVVRLYQHDIGNRDSIWWDTPECYTHPLNLYLLDELIEFIKQYK